MGGVKDLDAATFCQEVNSVSKLAVVEFYAPWCRTCTAVKPKYEAAAKLYDDIDFFRVDFKANKMLTFEERVIALPTVHFYVPEIGRVHRFLLSPSNAVPKLTREIRRYVSEPEEDVPSLLERLSLLRSQALTPLIRFKDLVGVLEGLAKAREYLAQGDDKSTALLQEKMSQDDARRANLEALFRWLDRDGNGTLDFGELAAAASALQPRGGRASGAADLLAQIEEESGGRDGVAIDLETFVSVLTRKAVADFRSPEGEYMAAFAALDVDGDGTVSKEELMEMVGAMCEAMPDPTLDLDVELLLPEAFAAFDADRSGAIDYKEYVNLVSGSKGACAIENAGDD